MKTNFTIKNAVKLIAGVFVFILFSTSSFAQTSGKSADQNPPSVSGKAAYQCPMKCEGDKTYSEPGKCPKCGATLSKLETKNETSSPGAGTAYQCPMKCEGDKTYTEKGKCPKCGMTLNEVKAKKVSKQEDQNSEGEHHHH